MKKLFTTIAVLALTAALAACGAAEPAVPGVVDKAPSSGEAVFPGLALTCEDVTPTGLTLVFAQEGGEELITGSYYSLEEFTADGWQPVEMLPQEYDVAWTDIAYLISAEGESRFPENWEWLYGALEEGSYRIGKQIIGGAGQSMYYAYFVIAPEGEPQTDPDHTHALASEPQTVEDPVSGYCGNTVTTVYLNGEEFSFWGTDSVALTDILINLSYDPEKVCRCAPEFTVDTEFGDGYGVNLTEGYARCGEGQADLTREQLDTILNIIDRLK